MSFSAGASGTQKTLAIRPCQKFEGHTHWVRGVIHLPGGQRIRIMTCSFDGSLRVWNLKTGEQIGDAWRDEENGVLAMAVSLDGKKIVCGCVDGVELWDIDTGKIIAKWTGHTSYVTSVCWNRDCGRVVSASGDGTARVWDVESGNTVLVIETGLSEMWAVIYSPDMTIIVTSGESEDLKEFMKIWDAKTGKLITNLKGHTETVFCLAWTTVYRRKHAYLWVIMSFDDSIMTWNTITWQQIHVLTGHTEPVRGIAISPNGPILASASWDKTARLWNLENGLSIGLPLQHPDFVQCVSFSTDGKLLATGCCHMKVDSEDSDADSEDSNADSEDINADSKDSNAYSWDISGILEEAGLLNPTVS